MAKEFSRQGRAIDGTGLFTPYTVYKRNDYYPLHILDGSNNNLVVQAEGSDNNIALSKKKFAEYVAGRHDGFDFGFATFAPIVDLVSEIIGNVQDN